MRVGIIRCKQTEDMCPGTMDFQLIRNKKRAFEGVEEDIEVYGMVSCGGCPGKKVLARAKEMVKRGADTIAFASCITKGNPIGFPCPHAEKILAMVGKKLGDKVKIMDHTH